MKCPKCKSDKFGSRPGEKGLVCEICGLRAYTNFDLVTATPEALVVAMSRRVMDYGMLIPGGCSICEFSGRCNDDCYTGILEYLKKEL